MCAHVTICRDLTGLTWSRHGRHFPHSRGGRVQRLRAVVIQPMGNPHSRRSLRTLAKLRAEEATSPQQERAITWQELTAFNNLDKLGTCYARRKLSDANRPVRSTCSQVGSRSNICVAAGAPNNLQDALKDTFRVTVSLPQPAAARASKS